ncbi:MAG: 2'-5' RNA ligase family protein [Clostridia bacterium]|nr:2'-5' RNA ligase family protein [Clostridia bacterium]
MFEIELLKIKDFNHKVMFIKPQINDELLNLHKTFNGNYADNYKWVPHITVFCGNRLQVIRAKKYIKTEFTPFTATIAAIEMGEFFPAKTIINCPLQAD